MSEYAPDRDATCCACTGKAVAKVIDGAFRKPVCESHGSMYRKQGFRVVGGPSSTSPGAPS